MNNISKQILLTYALLMSTIAPTKLIGTQPIITLTNEKIADKFTIEVTNAPYVLSAYYVPYGYKNPVHTGTITITLDLDRHILQVAANGKTETNFDEDKETVRELYQLWSSFLTAALKQDRRFFGDEMFSRSIEKLTYTPKQNSSIYFGAIYLYNKSIPSKMNHAHWSFISKDKDKRTESKFYCPRDIPITWIHTQMAEKWFIATVGFKPTIGLEKWDALKSSLQKRWYQAPLYEKMFLDPHNRYSLIRDISSLFKDIFLKLTGQ